MKRPFTGTLDDVTGDIVGKLTDLPLVQFNNIEKLPPSQVNAGPPAADAMPTSYGIVPVVLNDGPAAKIHLAGPPYAGALYVWKFGAQPQVHRSILSWLFKLDPNAVGKVQAVEAEFWQSQDRVKYMYGCQVNLAEGGRLQFNTNPAGPWLDTGVILPIVPGIWHALSYEIERLDASTLRYNAFTFDGTRHTDFSPLASVQPTVPTDWGDDTGVQLQQDVAGATAAFDCYVKNMKLDCFTQ